MKVRNGFVSNSSSSSFLVEHNINMFKRDDEDCLTDEQITLLEDHGFLKTTHMSVQNVYHGGLASETMTDDDGTEKFNMCASCSCNEEEYIVFLLKSGFAFTAYTHYGHNVFMWDGKSETFTQIKNLGNELEMYHQNESFEKLAAQAVRFPPIEQHWVPHYIVDNDDEYLDLTPAEKLKIVREMEKKKDENS